SASATAMTAAELLEAGPNGAQFPRGYTPSRVVGRRRTRPRSTLKLPQRFHHGAPAALLTHHRHHGGGHCAGADADTGACERGVHGAKHGGVPVAAYCRAQRSASRVRTYAIHRAPITPSKGPMIQYEGTTVEISFLSTAANTDDRNAIAAAAIP